MYFGVKKVKNKGTTRRKKIKQNKTKTNINKQINIKESYHMYASQNFSKGGYKGVSVGARPTDFIKASKIPTAVRELIDKCWHASPKKRFYFYCAKES